MRIEKRDETRKKGIEHAGGGAYLSFILHLAKSRNCRINCLLTGASDLSCRSCGSLMSPTFSRTGTCDWRIGRRLIDRHFPFIARQTSCVTLASNSLCRFFSLWPPPGLHPAIS